MVMTWLEKFQNWDEADQFMGANGIFICRFIHGMHSGVDWGTSVKNVGRIRFAG